MFDASLYVQICSVPKNINPHDFIWQKRIPKYESTFSDSLACKVKQISVAYWLPLEFIPTNSWEIICSTFVTRTSEYLFYVKFNGPKISFVLLQVLYTIWSMISVFGIMKNFRIFLYFQLLPYISFHVALSKYKAHLQCSICFIICFSHLLFFFVFYSSALFWLASWSLAWSTEAWIPLCISFFFLYSLCLCLS